jgi:hypothetical protein
LQTANVSREPRLAGQSRRRRKPDAFLLSLADLHVHRIASPGRTRQIGAQRRARLPSEYRPWQYSSRRTARYERNRV